MAVAAILKAVGHFGFANFELTMFFLVCVPLSSKSGGNCPFSSMHFKFQHGCGRQLESDRSLPVLHF
jgi:hypothetical protein